MSEKYRVRMSIVKDGEWVEQVVARLELPEPGYSSELRLDIEKYDDGEDEWITQASSIQPFGPWSGR